MKPTSSLTTSTQQQHQTVSIPPPLEAQLKSHLPATDVSFSSYLPRKKLDKSKSTSSPEEHLGSAPDDSELSIFNAQRCFGEGNQHDKVPGSSKRISPLEFRNLNLYKPSGFPRFSSASSIDGYGPGYRTRSLASEASQNSQTGLLSSNARGVNSGARICGKEWSRIIPRWLLLPPKCLCAGKKSVQVKERTVDNHRVSAPREAASPKMTVEVRSSKVNMIPDSQEGFQNTEIEREQDTLSTIQVSSQFHVP
ncbi:hypothetical protein SAY87_018650 [Trapa incisa]|uniref:Uncharacterized protein n=1 Tax=Trapa incisa TaxID=236973 RepID=A0AAN7K353_9MYRT|nr:hypothetical protein SAY87_018650 [Trapa incisa]